MYDTRGDAAREASEIEVGAQHILYGVTEVFEVMVVGDVYGFKEIEQRGAFVPRHIVGFFYHIVAVQGRKGYARNIGNVEWLYEFPVVVDYLVEGGLRVIDKVHLVDSQYDMLYS